MLSEEAKENLAQIFVDRVEDINASILQQIGSVIKQIGTLTPSQAYQLQQLLKYGGSYEKIAKELARISGKNVQDIYKIFDYVASENKEFAKQFYKYRGIDFIPYKKDFALQNIVNSIANLTASTYINISNTSGIGFMFEDLNGQMTFKNIRQSYDEIIDRAVISISQGKETYQQEMRRIMKDLGNNGLVMYESGKTRRLDSAVRMNILDGIRQVSIETSRRFGAEYGADGVEISVHINPAPDHEDIQGRQFSAEEYEKLENHQEAKDTKGREYDGAEKRQIGTLNCYHTEFPIVLGVSEPLYSDEELKKIRDDNNKGFEFEGKHYTNYEGTQLQRRLELELRKAKDTQILARASGDEFKDLAQESQARINRLTGKYKDLLNASGLKSQMKRASVSGYRKIKTNQIIIPNFAKTRSVIDAQMPLGKERSYIIENFDVQDFFKKYNNFYDSLDKNELLKVNNEYTKWNLEGEHPIGKYLNKTLKYDGKAEIIAKEDFFVDEHGNIISEDPDVAEMFLDENHWYRGISGKNEKETEMYIENFKYGEFYAGKGVNGNGTYVTNSYTYAKRYANYNEKGLLYIMPKENAKIVNIDKIHWIRGLLEKNIDKYKINNDLYLDFTTNVLSDEGYLASILGYDIININEAKIILNRKSIKVVK